jgi:hypothetical protein
MLGPAGRNVGFDAAIAQRLQVGLAAVAGIYRNLQRLAPEVLLDAIDKWDQLILIAHARCQAVRHDDLVGPSTAAYALLPWM